MADRDDVAIPLEVEHFFSYLFGKQGTHGLSSGPLRKGEWQEYLARLVDHIERYVFSNVVFTDAAHRQEIVFCVDDLRRSIGSEGREASLVAGLVRLCLLLLGHMPNHWERKVVNHPSHYLLDAYRTVGYSQSFEQRALVIADEYKRPAFVELDAGLGESVRDAYWTLTYPRRRIASLSNGSETSTKRSTLDSSLDLPLNGGNSMDGR